MLLSLIKKDLLLTWKYILLMAALFLLAGAPTLVSKCMNLRYAPAYVRGVVRRG